MLEKVPAYKTSDGQLFEIEQDAKDHEFELALDAYWADVRKDFSEEAAVNLMADLEQRLIDDRAKLLPIFKILNGGNPIILAPRPQPEGSTND